MKRPSTTTLAISVAVLAATVLLALVFRPSHSQWWTDGEAIRVPGQAAPIREILWRPAEPLKGTGFGAADEYEPRYSANGSTVVFVRNRPGHNADLYTSRWSPKGWSEPKPIDSINTEHDELGPELSRDGTSLYFYSDRPGGLGGYDLWVSHAEGDSWGTPTNLGPGVNSPWNEYGPALEPSGDHLYFSSNRPRPGEPATFADSWRATVREHRTRHDYDLYSADLSDPAAEAKPLSPLNTTADEGAPTISPSGDFLYFASDRAGGLGGFDIYRARIMRAGQLGAIENLGPGVNSASNDLDPALSSDGFRLTFSSDRATTNHAAPPNDAPVAASPDFKNGSKANPKEPNRYALWTSTSREVYRDVEVRQSSALEAWTKLWPWLLILLLSLVPLYFLYRLLKDQRWRTRFARLNLLAQCLLISLLIHAGLASLFTIWKVGTGLMNLAQHAGGTRVILTSSAPSGSVASQIRGDITDAPTLAPDADHALMSVVTSPIESSPLDIPLNALTAPLTTSPSVSTSEPDEKLAAATPTAPVNQPPAPAAVPTNAIPAATSTEAQPGTALTELHQAASPNIPVARSSPVQVALPSLTASRETHAPSIDSPAPVESPTLANSVAPTPNRQLASPAAIPTSTAPASASPEAQPRIAPTELRQAATPAVSAPASAPVQVTLPALATSSVAGTISMDAPAPAAHETPTLAGAAAPAQAQPGTPSLPIARAAAQTQEPTVAAADTSPPSTLTPAAPAPSSPTTNRVDLPLAKLAPTNLLDRPASSSLSPADLPSTTPAERTTASKPANSPASSNTSPTPPLPTPAAALTPKSDEAQTPTFKFADAPLALAPIDNPSPTPAHTETVLIAPPKRTTTKVAPTALGVLSEVDPDHHATPRTTPTATRTSPSANSQSQIPVGIPVPVETFAQRRPESRAKLIEKMGGSDKTERAVGLALDWFLRHQNKDGHWSADHYDDGCNQCPGAAEFKADSAMTGMVLLCYLGAGHTHQQEGPYRDAVNKGLQWLIKRQAPDGDLRQGETMYGQTVSAVALCEAFSMTRDPALAEPARKAVEFVLNRAASGRPASDRDTSVLGWLVFTVESAGRAGFEVPQATFDAARKWLSSVTAPATPGAYSYTRGGPASAAMTAEAMFVQQLLGHTRDEALMKQSARCVLASPPKWQEGAPTYYWYYATLSLFQQQGDPWKQWNDQLVPQLLSHQQQSGRASGSWDTTDPWSRMGGRIYQTAVCTLCLEVYYRYEAK